MNTLRCLRPVASRVQAVPFQKATLPQFVRAYSSKNFEYIQVSQPRPGVSQGQFALYLIGRLFPSLPGPQ